MNKQWADEAGFFKEVLEREMAGEIKPAEILKPKVYCVVCNREIEASILALRSCLGKVFSFSQHKRYVERVDRKRGEMVSRSDHSKVPS